ncbi:MAG TPA: hypothetical protein VMT86_02930 [Bryobacteraceae bacterium]|nr:hypothetical protein [Bryobacteraceae bacterium]
MKRRLAALLLWPALWLPAQTAQTLTYRAAMIGARGDTGAADILLHLVKDSSGNILSGSVDISLTYQLPVDTTVTGLGMTGDSTGTFVLDTGISAAQPLMAAAGRGTITRQIQVSAGDQAGIAALGGIVNDPGPYCLTLITPDQPAGAMSGELRGAQTAVLLAILSSTTATGTATVAVTYTGGLNSVSSVEVSIQTSYQFSGQVTFSGLRIYSPQGQIVFATDLLPGTVSAANGVGVLAVPATEVDTSTIQQQQLIESILTGPGSYSVQLDTVEYPGAPLTGTLRSTDSMTLPIPAFANAGAASVIGLHTLRAASGSIAAGAVVFDVNYRLPADAQISQLDLDGGLISPPVSTDPSGSGNIYAMLGVFNAAGLASLNGLVSDPAAHQIDLLTTADSSPLTALLAAPNQAAPAVAAVIPIVEVKDLSTFAPGELVEIYGTNLAAVTSDLSGWPGGSMPTELNGVSVTMGGQPGSILYVSPYQVDAAFPFETPAGSQMLTLGNANGVSIPISLNVAPVAPALYNFAFENADFSEVSATNPASTGDILVFYATGMGQTTPALGSGQTVPFGPPYYYTQPVTVTIGGVNANVVYSIAAPPYVTGLYQMAVTVPAGLPPGNQPVVATSGGLQSNAITIAVK